MKRKIEQFKQFLRMSNIRKQTAALQACLSVNTIVYLNPEEKDFVNMQTDRMIMRKSARQRRLDPARDWTALLPSMPNRGSAYAIRAGR
ncbi:MAG: hypothetical protein IKJ44_01935 [Elusimicrobiaceae bacterium]|nr:hypothetical protein [Elusimicrobiaceae bacterium]